MKSDECIKCEFFSNSGLDGCLGWCIKKKWWIPLSKNVSAFCPLEDTSQQVDASEEIKTDGG